MEIKGSVLPEKSNNGKGRFNFIPRSLQKDHLGDEDELFNENWIEGFSFDAEVYEPAQKSKYKSDLTLLTLLEKMATIQSGFSFDKEEGILCGERGMPIIKTSTTPAGETLSIKDPEGINALVGLARDAEVVFTVNKCPSLEAAARLILY